MTDIAVEKWTYAPPDRSWLLFEATGNSGPVPTTHGVIDFSLFDAATQYPDGYIPAGTLVGVVTASGSYGPYNDTATDGRQTAAGFLYNPVHVPDDTARKVTVAVIDCFAIVSTSRLPESSGYNAAAAADLPLVKFRA